MQLWCLYTGFFFGFLSTLFNFGIGCQPLGYISSISATSHPQSTLSATSHPHSATSHPHSATSRPSLTASTRTLNLNTVRDWSCRVLLRVVFSSVEWFGREFREFASNFVLRNGIPSCFLFRWRVWKGIPRVYFYFCSTERNSESLLLFLVLGTEFRVVFSSGKGSERNSENSCYAEQPEFRRK
jgi:hypothetical protein